MGLSHYPVRPLPGTPPARIVLPYLPGANLKSTYELHYARQAPWMPAAHAAQHLVIPT